jgi:ribosomal protein S18 acetylase RimI-like enzyme
MQYTIASVTPSNLTDHPQAICFINPKHPSYHFKVKWFQQRFEEGLRIKLLYPDGEKKAAAYIEYVPGEKAWRPVDAPGYLFIHCLWVSPDKNKKLGYGSALINHCLQEAKTQGKKGLAVISSSDSFMAEKQVFEKNGFTLLQSAKNHELLVLPISNGALPKMNDHAAHLPNYHGLHIVYSAQCPWVARFVDEVKQSPDYKQLKISITELKTPEEAQQAPSFYGVFTLINNGKLLSSHYISSTRFNNILRKEGLL